MRGVQANPPPPGTMPLTIGMVIDLTNSRRYYDPAEFTQNGVVYIKV